MADLTKQIKVELIADDKTKAAFDSATKNVEKANMSFRDLVGGVALGQAAFSIAATAITAAGRALGGFVKESISTSLEMERVNKVLPVVAANTGKTEKEINSLIYAIREEGKSMLEAKSISLELARAQLGEKEALQLISAARDLAATAGVSSSTANQAILQSVNQLTPAFLQQLGIQVSLRVAYEDYSKATGIAITNMTTADKKMAIFNTTMKEAEKVAGAYDAAMGASSKLLKSFADGFESVKLAIGDMLSGAAYPLIAAAYDIERKFNKWAYTTENELNPTLAGVRDFIAGTLLGTLEFLRNSIDFVGESYAKLMLYLADMGVLDAFRNAWERIVAVYNDELKPAVDRLLEALQPYMPLLKDIAELIGTILVLGLLVFLETLTRVIETVTLGVAAFANVSAIVLDTFAPAIDVARGYVKGLSDAVERLIKKFQEAVAAAQNAASAIKNAFSSSIDAVGSALTGGADAAKNSYYRNKIPAMAAGGIVTKPTIALIGESGAEAVVPLGKGSGGFGGISVLQGATINVSGEADENRLVSKISQELARTLQSQRQGLATLY